MFDAFVDVVEVLSGEFSSVFEACGWLRLSEDVHGHVFDPGHVFGAVAGPQADEVVMEDHIQNPVQAVLDVPMGAHRARRSWRRAVPTADNSAARNWPCLRSRPRPWR